jgi:hypothetical protein
VAREALRVEWQPPYHLRTPKTARAKAASELGALSCARSLRHRVLRMLQRKLAPAGNQINFGEVVMSAQGHSRRYCHVRSLVRYPQHRTLPRRTETVSLSRSCSRRSCCVLALDLRRHVPKNRVGLEAQDRRCLAPIACSEVARHGRRRWALFVRRAPMMPQPATRSNRQVCDAPRSCTTRRGPPDFPISQGGPVILR